MRMFPATTSDRQFKRGSSLANANQAKQNEKQGEKKKAPKEQLKSVWPMIKELVRPRRALLGLGLLLLLIGRLAGLILPASTKFLIDDVINKHRPDKLLSLVLVVACATLRSEERRVGKGC